jgi:hypothetical protein
VAELLISILQEDQVALGEMVGLLQELTLLVELGVEVVLEVMLILL